jgi:N-methylhydantoinase A
MRPVYWTEACERLATPVHRGEELAAGVTVNGPAILEFPDTTLVVHPGQGARADELGNVELLMEV